MENKEKLTLEFENDKTDDNVLNVNSDSHSSHHHSHHHSHSHHHHSSQRKHRKQKEKAKKFWKRNKYKIANAFIIMLFVAVLAVFGVLLDKQSYSDDNGSFSDSSGNAIQNEELSLQIKIPFFGENVVIAGPAIEAYAKADPSVQAIKIYRDYSALGRLDIGLPVTISYDINDVPQNGRVINADLYISQDENFSSAIKYSFGDDENTIKVYHLKTNEEYFYRIELSFSNGSKANAGGSFKTANTPRVLSVEGVYNMRDIGGWKTVDGKIIRQGLLYRSSELDGAVESKYTITANGVTTMLSVLGIRSEMDLRSSDDNASKTNPLGAGVEHKYYNMPMYSDVFTDAGKAAVKSVFSDLADKNKYPVLMHCTHGMDRTGTVCYLLEAILGVDEESLMKEYQLSALCYGEMWALNQMNEFIGRLKAFEGNTIQDKAVNYLLSAGVTSAQIESIREIFLEANK